MLFNENFSLSKEVSVIDAHIHLKNMNDGIEFGFKDYFEAISHYIESVNLQYACVNCMPGINIYDFDQNILAAFLKLENPKIFAQGGLCHIVQPVTSPPPKEFSYKLQAEELYALGFDGIKMIEGKPNIRKEIGLPLNSPLLDEFYDYLEENGTHIISHVNDPDEFWDKSKLSEEELKRGWFYGREGFLSYEEHYNEIFSVLAKNPNLKITFAHLMFLGKDPKRLTDMFDTYKNVAVDLTPGGEMFENMQSNLDLWHEIFEKYPDRFLFGTDMASHKPPILGNHIIGAVYDFLTTDKEIRLYSRTFKGLNLSQDTVEKIIRNNFVNRVSDTPKPINKTFLAKYIEKYLPIIKSEESRKFILQYAEKKL